jgi:hypothetical protein
LPTTEELLRDFERQVVLPWRDDLAPEYRVWILHYEPALERRIVPGWRNLRRSRGVTAKDGSPSTSRRSSRLGSPRMPSLRDSWSNQTSCRMLPEFAARIGETVRRELDAVGTNDILALLGAGGLFGLMRISTLIESVAAAIPGRLLVFFPGRYEEGSYRLLDARDGWNYRATPIPA